MIYITGDTHGDFSRFTRKMRSRLPFLLKEDDYIIVTGDFGLLWVDDKTFLYNLDWMSRLPFQILWIQGNHENYDMIKKYPLETWKGGKVRHIIRNKIILLERGQVFEIEGKTFFTFGGASSHDAPGGLLDRSAPDFEAKRENAVRRKQTYRVLNENWWKEELPTMEELQEGRENLRKNDNKVDYVITHCGSNRVQKFYTKYAFDVMKKEVFYDQNILTDYFEELEHVLKYKHWYCGHYHEHLPVDDKHTILSEHIIPIDD